MDPTGGTFAAAGDASAPPGGEPGNAIVVAATAAATSRGLAVVDAVGPDRQFVELWINGARSEHTRRNYRRHCITFYRFTGKPLRAVTLGDLQAFAAHLAGAGLVAGSQHAALAAIKSLFAFCARVGFLTFDVATPLRLPACKDTLNERILDEEEVRRLIDAAGDGRDRLILWLLYVAGPRVSELAALSWRDVSSRRGGGGQITIFGKGGKTRSVLLEGEIWSAIETARGSAKSLDVPIFVSRRGGHLDVSTVRRIVAAAAKRAAINKPVSPHWLRHCHGSHALDHGAPVHLVQQTLGHASVATTSRYLHARPTESSSSFIPRVRQPT